MFCGGATSDVVGVLLLPILLFNGELLFIPRVFEEEEEEEGEKEGEEEGNTVASLGLVVVLLFLLLAEAGAGFLNSMLESSPTVFCGATSETNTRPSYIHVYIIIIYIYNF